MITQIATASAFFFLINAFLTAEQILVEYIDG
jgi:hypothetical protein